MIPKKSFFIGLLILNILITYCSSQKKIEESNTIKNNVVLKKPLPVGMVDLNCIVNEFIEKKEKLLCNALIIKIHGYGNSVRALSENQVYEFEIDKNLIGNFEQTSIIGKVIRCRLIKGLGGMERISLDKLKIVSIENL